MADSPADRGADKRQVDFSCIIPTHDRDELLEAALDSIADQTVQPREVIVSDNLVREETRALVKSFDASVPFSVRYLGHHQGGRGCISRNLAAQEAGGQYLAFLDDDDLWKPEFLASVDASFAARQTDAVYVWITYLFPSGEQEAGRKIAEDLGVGDFVIRNPGTVISNLAVKRSVFLELGGFDESMHPPYDRDFAMRLLQRGNSYSVVPQELLLFRQHEGARESRPGESYARGQRAFFERYRDKVRPSLRLRFWLKIKASAIRSGLEHLVFPLGAVVVGTDHILKKLERKIGRALG